MKSGRGYLSFEQGCEEWLNWRRFGSASCQLIKVEMLCATIAPLAFIHRISSMKTIEKILTV